MKNKTFIAIILLSVLPALSGCVTIICNSERIQRTSTETQETFKDKSTKTQAKTITNDKGLF